jgi:hypothetical protein
LTPSRNPIPLPRLIKKVRTRFAALSVSVIAIFIP